MGFKLEYLKTTLNKLSNDICRCLGDFVLSVYRIR